MKIVGILKITRIPTLSKIINRIDFREEMKGYFAILVMTTYLFIYVHCTTCLFFFLMSIDKTYVPIKDMPLKATDLFSREQPYQYFMAMYYMVLVVGGNETAPSNVTLKFYSAFAVIVGNLFLANIMGSMADYIGIITRKDN